MRNHCPTRCPLQVRPLQGVMVRAILSGRLLEQVCYPTREAWLKSIALGLEIAILGSDMPNTSIVE